MTSPAPFDLLALLLAGAGGIAYLNHKVLHLPLTVGLLVGAFAGSLALIGLNAIDPGLALQAKIGRTLNGIDFPGLLLNGFLGFLLFAGALQVNAADMLERKWTVLVLATVGTVVSTALVGIALRGVAEVFRVNLAWSWCLVFGALISPTDPISVLDVLKRVGISRHLQATFAGESLFNDGVGVVLFTLLVSVATAGPAADISLRHIAALFYLQAGLGAALGLVLGAAALLLLRRIDDTNVELIISLALASGTYSLAGRLGVSGPVGVVVAGLLIGNQGMKHAMTEATRQHLMTFWLLVEEVLNALLFLLIGLQMVAIDLHWKNVMAMTAMIPIVLLARWLSVAISAVPLHVRADNKFGALLVLSWGGLRGGLSVAMALSLPVSAAKAPILTMAYGIVVFSIVVQGLTLERLARRALT